MEGNEERRFKCSLCFFECALQNNLIDHYLKNHRYDPEFKIQCNERGCGATYTKWKSFTAHLARKHHNEEQNADELAEPMQLGVADRIQIGQENNEGILKYLN